MLNPVVPFRSNSNLFKVFTLLSEFFLINLSCRFSYYLRYNEFSPIEDYYVSFFLIFSLGWMGISLSNGGYDTRNLIQLKTLVRNIFASSTLHIFLILLYIVSTKAQYLSRYYLILTYSSTICTILTFRSLLFLGYQYFDSLNYHIRRVVLVGDQPIIEEMRSFFGGHRTQVHHFIRSLAPELESEEKSVYMKSILEEVQAFCVAHQINELYFSIDLASEETIDTLTDFADRHFIYLRVITDLNPLRRRTFNIDFVGPFPTLSMRQEPLKKLYNRMVKRVFDIFFSLLVILFVFPIALPIIAVAIKFSSKGPIFFKQQRHGRVNRPFTCYKFRTMYVASDDTRQATKDDPRVTPVGRFLRKTSLDELPQFLNVLRGEMSVVGPRPHAVNHTDAFQEHAPKYLRRHFVLPGITGHAQVHGLRGEIERPEEIEERVSYDSWYIENWNLLLDLKIIVQTLGVMFRPQDKAY
ncbi:MAG: undecaprenyl-phosphate glucose phosphotransferase [Bacteroidota bacterium]